MGTAQTKATNKYREKMGIISKSFKLHKTLLEDFKKACEKNGVPQVKLIREFMEDYVAKNKD